MFIGKKRNKTPNEKYQWTFHVHDKMRYYNLSASRIKRVIRHPKRVEEGIARNTIAVMCPAETKKYQEIWVLYQIKNHSAGQRTKIVKPKNTLEAGRIRIISAWIYPGKSPERNPIPKEILDEIKALL